MKVTFDVVSLPGEKRLPCDGCGKKLTRRTKVWQTENPYNRNSDGLMKSRSEIYAELREKLAEWRTVGIVCKDCAGNVWDVRHWYGETTAKQGVHPNLYTGQRGWYDRPDRWGYYSLAESQDAALAEAMAWHSGRSAP